MHVSPGFARVIFLAARMRGLDVVALAGSVGIAAADVGDPELAVPFQRVLELWQEAAARARDPVFGLHAAEALQRCGVMGLFGVLDFVTTTSATLGDAMRRLCRYQEILAERNVTMTVEDRGPSASIRTAWQTHDAETLRHHVEFSNAIACLRIRGLAGADLAPYVLRFRHAAPADRREHERLFRTTLEFGAACDEVVFDRAILARPLFTADPALCAVLDRRAEDLVARVHLGERVAAEVTRQIAARLPAGRVDLAEVAESIGMSGRTLQRRLDAEGTTFHALLDATRKTIALAELERGEASLAEVAFLVGYSEPAAFHRAFQRWTGRTPRGSGRPATSG